MRELGSISSRPQRRKEVLETATHLLTGLSKTPSTTFLTTRLLIIHFTLRATHLSETPKILSQFQRMDQSPSRILNSKETNPNG